MMNYREAAKKVFAAELASIKKDAFRDKILNVFEHETPHYFFNAPASSSGKHHPMVSNGQYGLIRHTKLVCAVAKELFSAFEEELTDWDKDCIIAACLLHDLQKYGLEADKNGIGGPPGITQEHGDKLYMRTAKYDLPYAVRRGIQTHMGRWSSITAKTLWHEENMADIVILIVHLADYIASRKFEAKYDLLMRFDYGKLLSEV